MKLYTVIMMTFVVLVTFSSAGCGSSREGNDVTEDGHRESPYESEEERLAMYNQTLELVQDINQNSDFGGLELLEFSELTKERAEQYGDDHPEIAFSEAGRKIDAYYFPYPSNSDDRRLTQIHIKEEPYHIYHITVGQTLSDGAAVLEQKGFTEYLNSHLYGDLNSIVYKKFDIYISFQYKTDSDVISNVVVVVTDRP